MAKVDNKVFYIFGDDNMKSISATRSGRYIYQPR